jgi:hypothetical protein
MNKLAYSLCAVVAAIACDSNPSQTNIYIIQPGAGGGPALPDASIAAGSPAGGTRIEAGGPSAGVTPVAGAGGSLQGAGGTTVTGGSSPATGGTSSTGGATAGGSATGGVNTARWAVYDGTVCGGPIADSAKCKPAGSCVNATVSSSAFAATIPAPTVPEPALCGPGTTSQLATMAVQRAWTAYTLDQCTVGAYSNSTPADQQCIQCLARHGLIAYITPNDSLSGYRFLLGGLSRTGEPNTGCAKVNWNLIQCLQAACGTTPVSPPGSGTRNAFGNCLDSATTTGTCFGAYQDSELALNTLGLSTPVAADSWNDAAAGTAWVAAGVAACGGSA